jgi:hypothetical protein
MKQPEWVKTYKKSKKEIPDQITILSIGTKGGVPGMLPQPIGSRETGSGADGTMQPSKYAGDVHEGEMVLSANATQALPPDVRQALVEQAESGKLDVNALRSALNLQSKPGFASGSFGQPVEDVMKSSGDTSTSGGANNTTIANTAFNPVKVPKIEAVENKIAPIAGGTSSLMSSDAGSGATQTTDSTGTLNKAFSPVVANKPVGSEIKISPNAPGTKPPATTTTAIAPGVPSAYENSFKQGLRQQQDIAAGTDTASKNIANTAVRQYDTQAANQIAAGDQQLAVNKNLPEGTADSLAAQNRSSVRSGRSELVADLASNQQERASAASMNAANLGASGMAHEEGKRQFDTTFSENKRLNDFNNGLVKAKALMELGIGGNKDAIVAAMKDIGIDINPDTLTNADSADKFTKAMDLITKAANTPGMEWPQVEALLKDQGLYDAVSATMKTSATAPQWTGDPAENPILKAATGDPTKLTPKDVDWLIDNDYDMDGKYTGDNGLANVFKGIKTDNPIDNELKTITDSKWFKGLNPTVQAKTIAMYNFSLTGEDQPYDAVWDPTKGLETDPNAYTRVIKSTTPKTDVVTPTYTAGNPFGTNGLKILEGGKSDTNTNFSAVLDDIEKTIGKNLNLSALNTLKTSNPKAYENVVNEIKSRATTWTGATSTSRSGNRGTHAWSTLPKAGNIINHNGATYLVNDDATTFTSPNGLWTNGKFVVTDIATGETYTVTNEYGKTNMIPTTPKPEPVTTPVATGSGLFYGDTDYGRPDDPQPIDYGGLGDSQIR